VSGFVGALVWSLIVIPPALLLIVDYRGIGRSIARTMNDASPWSSASRAEFSYRVVRGVAVAMVIVTALALVGGVFELLP
jgi:hypothetical protein